MTNDEPVREWLSAEASHHTPDRERIWGRVESAMADSAQAAKIRRWGMPLIVTAVLTGVAVGGWTLIRPEPYPQPARPIAEAGSPIGSSTTVPPADLANASPRPLRTGRPSPTAKRRTAWPSDGSLLTVRGTRDRRGAQRSVARSTDHTVTLTVRRPISALTVTIRVSGGRPSMAWTSAPRPDFTTVSRPARGEIIYRFELNRGRTLVPGVHTFAARYFQGRDHADRRPRASFSVVARPSDGGYGVTVRGRF